jgi:hypothetical protein
VLVELDTRHPSQPASGSPAVRGDRARAVFGHAMGLVALTVGCLALSAYMGRDLTGGAAIALSVDAVICLVGLNSASATGAITRPTLLFGHGLPGGSVRRPAITGGVSDAAPITTRDH